MSIKDTDVDDEEFGIIIDAKKLFGLRKSYHKAKRREKKTSWTHMDELNVQKARREMDIERSKLRGKKDVTEN